MRVVDFYRVTSREGGLTRLLRVARFDERAADGGPAANDGTLDRDAAVYVPIRPCDPPNGR
jgi:hypothetical protein